MWQKICKENTKLKDIIYHIGDEEVIVNMPSVHAKTPFDNTVVDFLNKVSKKLLSSREAKKYPDVVTLGFWMRKSSIIKLKERFAYDDDNVHLGRGIAFHIAPSNVPVNYAYSLVSGLITGNANIIRIPSKNFPQISIINKAIIEVLEEEQDMKPYICLIQYEKNLEINDVLSSIADTRIIWGGDATIEDIRKSPLAPRASEITFADRYSFSVIDSNVYMADANKKQIAADFYNDTYLTDQNACTSPRMVIWTGNKIEQAKEIFWSELYSLVKDKYVFQDIQGINKLSSSYLLVAYNAGVKVRKNGDNLIFRVQIPAITNNIMNFKDNSGYFIEYDCINIMELQELCNDEHCQTISYIGNKEMFLPLIKSGIKGIDRIVPVGKTMDFDLIWDGYNLAERLTRIVNIK